MKKIIPLALASTLVLSLTACYSPQDRALGGAALGGIAGAAIGGAATGRAGGALAGAAIGAAGGAVVGAATAPERRRRGGCFNGVVYDRYGNAFCR